MSDLTSLILDTKYDAFKQNTIYTGSLTISGTTSGGTNTKTWTVTLGSTPDMADILFNGPTDLVLGQDPRPSSGWFKGGRVWVPTDNAGGGNPSPWLVYGSLKGSILTITAQYVQTFTIVEALTATNFSYRVIDYSIF